MGIIQLTLPVPPSVNTIWRVSNGRMVKSAKYREWLSCCDVYALQSRVPRPGIKKPCAVDVVIRTGHGWKTSRDIDNILKPILDWLVKTTASSLCGSVSVTVGVIGNTQTCELFYVSQNRGTVSHGPVHKQCTWCRDCWSGWCRGRGCGTGSGTGLSSLTCSGNPPTVGHFRGCSGHTDRLSGSRSGTWSGGTGGLSHAKDNK